MSSQLTDNLKRKVKDPVPLPEVPKKLKSCIQLEVRMETKKLSFYHGPTEVREYNIRDPPCPNVNPTGMSKFLVYKLPTKNVTEYDKEKKAHKQAQIDFFLQHGFVEEIFEEEMQSVGVKGEIITWVKTKRRFTSATFRPQNRFRLNHVDWVAAEMGTTVQYP